MIYFTWVWIRFGQMVNSGQLTPNPGKLSHGNTLLKEAIFLGPFVIDTFLLFKMIRILSLG